MWVAKSSGDKTWGDVLARSCETNLLEIYDETINAKTLQ